ncbi:hypothetical protein JB92DRAFT_2713104, partial [Gautieria morchelliformis]
LRLIDIVFESLDRVDGSAPFAFGPTKDLASVSGPIQGRLTAEQPSKATFEVLVRALSGISDTDAKSFSTVHRTMLAPCLVLTQNPRTLIQFVVESLTATTPARDPSLAAVFINASSLALLLLSDAQCRVCSCSWAYEKASFRSRTQLGAILARPKRARNTSM